jgi:hypothetical protein
MPIATTSADFVAGSAPSRPHQRLQWQTFVIAFGGKWSPRVRQLTHDFNLLAARHPAGAGAARAHRSNSTGATASATLTIKASA